MDETFQRTAFLRVHFNLSEIWKIHDRTLFTYLAYQHRQEKDQLETGVLGTSLVVQWLGLRTSNEGGRGSIPGRGTRIPHATWPGAAKK